MGAPPVMEGLAQRAQMMRESLHKSEKNTEKIVSILGSFDHRLSTLETAMRPTQVEAKIMRGPMEDLESYLAAVDQLRDNVEFFNCNKSFKSSDGVLTNANSLLAKAMLKLEEEFKQLLSAYSKVVEPERLFECLPNSLRPSTGSPGNLGDHSVKKNHTEQIARGTEGSAYTLPTLIPPRIIPQLHDLAQRMDEAGHGQQCLKIYRDTRASILEQSLRKLGVEKLSKDDVQKMQWEVLEGKIDNWIHFMRIAVKLLFAGERKVCDQIFEDLDPLKDQCFAEVTTNSVITLLSFGDAIAKSKRSPEKLFVLLDMYETMRELLPEVLGAPYRGGNAILSNNTQLLTPVGNRVTVIDLVKSEISRIALSPDGTLLLSIDEVGRCLLINVHRRVILHRISFKGAVAAIKFSPDGSHFAVGVGKSVQVWRMPAFRKEFMPFELVRNLTGCNDALTCLDWSPDGNWIIAGSKDLCVRIFCVKIVENYRPVKLLGHRDVVMGAFFRVSKGVVDGAYSVSKDGAIFSWKFYLDDVLQNNVISNNRDAAVSINVRNSDSKRKWEDEDDAEDFTVLINPNETLKKKKTKSSKSS